MPEKSNPKIWLTELLLGAANVTAKDNALLTSLVHINFYDGETGKFEIFGIRSGDEEKGQPLVKTRTYKLYVTKLPTDRFGLMKISLTPDFNYVISNEAEILKGAQQIALECDNEHLATKETPPYYGSMFPNVVEEINADKRKAVFLGYQDCIENYKQLVPLSVITKDQRVDLQTAHWIFGKLLKLLSFFHSQKWAINTINSSNVLIERNLHGVFVLDFSETSDIQNNYDCVNDIVGAGKLAWQAAGGDETNDPPFDPEIMSKENYDKYVGFLRRIIKGETGRAFDEYEAIYKLSDEIWPKVPKSDGNGMKRQFHEWKTYPKKINEREGLL